MSITQNRLMRAPHPIPQRIGPVEFGALGSWVTVRCPRDYDSLMHEVIADHTIGDAILDRVIHRAHRLELKGPSMRKRHNTEVSATAQA